MRFFHESSWRLKSYELISQKMLHLRRKYTTLEVWLGSQYILSVEMLLDRFGQWNKFWKKPLKKVVISKFEYSEDPLGDGLEKVLGTSLINLPGTSLKRQIRTTHGRHCRMSLGCQIRTSLGQSNRIFRRRPGDVGGEHPRDVLGTNIRSKF